MNDSTRGVFFIVFVIFIFVVFVVLVIVIVIFVIFVIRILPRRIDRILSVAKDDISDLFKRNFVPDVANGDVDYEIQHNERRSLACCWY